MRLGLLVLAAGAALAACGPMRGANPGLLEARAPHDAGGSQEAPPQAAPTPSAGASLGRIAHPAIDVWEQRLRGERKWRATITKGVGRGADTLGRVRAMVAASGLPPALALLPVIESGYRTNARGPGGSVGIWQLQARTARRFGLSVTRARDDRLDPERSTRAAIGYLRLLYARYGDWPLTLAAYNLGEGRVDRALARCPGATLWQLTDERHLPGVSRDYVSHFLALVRVIDDETPDDSLRVARAGDSM